MIKYEWEQMNDLDLEKMKNLIRAFSITHKNIHLLLLEDLEFHNSKFSTFSKYPFPEKEIVVGNLSKI